MTLYEFLKTRNDGEEVTVCDNDYDMETYFYNDEDPEDKWQTSMLELSKLLTIKKEKGFCVTVNLSEVIEKKIDKLKEANLFIECDIDCIMDDISSILAGYVSESWLEKFVNILKED